MDYLKKKRLQTEDPEKYKDHINKISSTEENLTNQRNELIRPPGSMNYRTRPRLREEILSILYAINSIPAQPTASQMDRTVSLSKEMAEKDKLLEDTKQKEVREILETLEALPLLNLRVKSVKP